MSAGAVRFGGVVVSRLWFVSTVLLRASRDPATGLRAADSACVGPGTGRVQGLVVGPGEDGEAAQGSVRVYVDTRGCVYICIYIHVCVYVCRYTCVYIYAHMPVRVCMGCPWGGAR